MIIGFIFGATNIIRFGPGPNGMLRTLGQYMVGSAATFGYTYLGIVEGRTTMLTRGPASSCPSARQYEQKARPSSQKHSGRHRRGMVLPWSCRSRGCGGQRWRSTGHEQARLRCQCCTKCSDVLGCTGWRCWLAGRHLLSHECMDSSSFSHLHPHFRLSVILIMAHSPHSRL